MEKKDKTKEGFKAIFDNAGDGILLARIGSKKFYIGNKAICRMLGYSSKEIKNLGVTDIHPEKDIPYVLDQFKRQAKEEFSLSRDLPVKRKNDSVFYADVNATTVKIAGETYLMGFFHDNTERNKAETQLKEKLVELKKMNELMVDRELKMVEMKERIKELESKLAKKT